MHDPHPTFVWRKLHKIAPRLTAPFYGFSDKRLQNDQRQRLINFVVTLVRGVFKMNTPSAKKKIDRRLESVLAGVESESIALVAGIAA